MALAVRSNIEYGAADYALGLAEKSYTFKVYCHVHYTCNLSSNYTQKAINAFCIQYNNRFRMLT